MAMVNNQMVRVTISPLIQIEILSFSVSTPSFDHSDLLMVAGAMPNFFRLRSHV